MPSHYLEVGDGWLERGQEPPAIARRGKLSITSGVPGINPDTGRIPADPADQFNLAYDNLARLVAESGCSKDSIVLVEVTICERGLRELIDPVWLEWFPSAGSRPARKTNQRPLPTGVAVQLQAVCIDGKRRSWELDGLKHRAPIPMGASIEGYLFSSVIGGDDPCTGKMVDAPRKQIELAFENCADLMRAAGGDESGINHLWVFLADPAHAQAMLDCYLRMFSQEGNRPARKTLPYDLPQGCAVQIQMSGQVGGTRSNYEVPGFRHHDPIPLASRTGNLLQSSGIHGVTPGTRNIAPGGVEHQTELVCTTLEAALDEAGGALADIATLLVLVDDLSDAKRIYPILADRFGPADRPAIRFAQAKLPPDMNMQAHLTAWLP